MQTIIDAMLRDGFGRQAIKYSKIHQVFDSIVAPQIQIQPHPMIGHFLVFNNSYKMFSWLEG